MSRAAKSVYLFSFYLMAVGILLIFIPNFLLRVFALPSAENVWIRIVGMLTFVLGFYYLKSAQHNIRSFFKWTVYGRLAGFLMFCYLGVSGTGPTVLVLFGIIDGISAYWTLHSLKLPEASNADTTKGSRPSGDGL